MANSKDDILLEKIIIILVVAAGAIINKEKDEKTVEQTHTKAIKEKIPLTFNEKLNFGLIAIIGVLIIFNHMQISQSSSMFSGGSKSTSFVNSISTNLLKLGSGSSKHGTVIGPQLNTDGRTTKLVEWPTISENSAPKKTGDAQKDAIAVVVPTGTPFYALEGPGADKIKGATFDDPIVSQKVWASLLGSKRFGTSNTIQLTNEEENRWQKITGPFTCDYCCGGPNSVTTISRCGCAHSYAWQGMAKFFIKYYPQYTDEQIKGEMTRWKGLWYPKGMIQDYLVYNGQMSVDALTHGGSSGIKQQFLQQGSSGQKHTQATATPLDELPSMVGGC